MRAWVFLWCLYEIRKSQSNILSSRWLLHTIYTHYGLNDAFQGKCSDVCIPPPDNLQVAINVSSAPLFTALFFKITFSILGVSDVWNHNKIIIFVFVCMLSVLNNPYGCTYNIHLFHPNTSGILCNRGSRNHVLWHHDKYLLKLLYKTWPLIFSNIKVHM